MAINKPRQNRRTGSRVLSGTTDATQRLLDELRCVAAEREAAETQEPQPPPDADLAVGRVLARRMLDANPGLEKSLREGAITLVVEVPSAEHVEIISSGLQDLILGEQEEKPTWPAEDVAEWLLFARDGSQRTHRPEEGNLSVRKALARGTPIIGISQAPERYLPRDMVRIADRRVVIPAIDALVVRDVALSLTGRMPKAMLEAETASAVTLAELMLAVRRERDPDAYVERVRSLVAERKTGTPAVTLDRLHGMDEVVRWGTALARDLADYRAGCLSWADVDRGVLLVGPPGVGKTTAARALAATCDVPLVSGSLAQWQAKGHLGDLLKAMTTTFDEARSKAPCILFVDEIESVGDRARFSGHNSGYETQVMNGFLEQLDGIGGREGVVVVGATNYPDRLDPAVRRPGRLDRTVEIGLPDEKALVGILRHHLGSDLPGADLGQPATMLIGASGAQVEQHVRDARRRARHERRAMLPDDLLHAILSGRPKLSPEERRRAAVHEAGHALVAVIQRPGSVRRISLLTTADTGGFVTASWGDEVMLTPNGILSRLRFILAGRAAEEVALGVPSTGAGGSPDSDLAKATGLAVTALCALGMRQGEHALVWQGLHGPDRIPTVLAAHPEIAREVAELLDTAYAQAADMLRRNRALLDDLVQMLLTSEILGPDVINAIVARHRANDAEHLESRADALVRE